MCCWPHRGVSMIEGDVEVPDIGAPPQERELMRDGLWLVGRPADPVDSGRATDQQMENR